MTRRQPAVKHDPRRGRRKAASAETARWEAEHLIPERPVWLDAATYAKLARMRDALT